MVTIKNHPDRNPEDDGEAFQTLNTCLTKTALGRRDEQIK